MTQILDDPAMRTPAMMYLFHRVEERLDGTAAIIVVDEGWKALDDDVFVRRIKDWEKTIRKRNGIVGFATQSAQDALESRIASAIIEQAATQIFMANPKARAADYIDGFGLTPHEYELVRTLPDNAHCFLIKHGAESVVARLNLTGEHDLLTILSGRERTVRLLDEIRADQRRRSRRLDPAPAGGRMIAPSALRRRRRRLPQRRADTMSTARRRRSAPAAIRRWPRRDRRCRWSLTGLLTLFVALFGYRMLFGQTPGVRDGVLALVKIGIVLALATSWPAYRTLVYDVALKGPAELAGEIGRPAGLPGAGGGLVARLDYADRASSRSPIARAPATPPAATGRQTNAGPASGRPRRRPVRPDFDSFALGGARIALPRRRDRRARRRCGWSPACCSRSGRSSSPSCCSTGRAACSRAGCGRSPAPRSARSARRSCSASSWRCSSRGSPT